MPTFAVLHHPFLGPLWRSNLLSRPARPWRSRRAKQPKRSEAPTRLWARRHQRAVQCGAAWTGGSPRFPCLPPRPETRSSPSPHVEGVKARAFDFCTLGLPTDVALLLADAARNHPEPLAPITHGGYWTRIRVFARFARETQAVRSVRDLTSQMVWNYRAWLDGRTNPRTNKPWTKKTRAQALHVLRALIHTIKDLEPERLPSAIVFPTPAYRDREPAAQPVHLKEGELKALLWCCQREITEAVTRFKTGQEILAKEVSSGREDGMEPIIRAIASLNASGFRFPTSTTCRGD